MKKYAEKETNAEEEQMRRNVAALLVALFLLCGRPLCAKAESESSVAEETCGITGLSVRQTTEEGVQVEVVFTTGEQAELVVALYDAADDRVMLACGAEEVDAGQEQCEIFAVWKNKAYSSFKVAAYLIKQNRERLLCPSAYVLHRDAAKTEQPDRAGETADSTSDTATPGDFADWVNAPYENAYLFAYTLAQQDQQGRYLTDPFAQESLLYIAQRSGEELLTVSMEIPAEALVICNACGFSDAPIFLQEEEEDTEEGKDASSETATTEEETEASGNTGGGPESADGTAGAGSNASAVDGAQSMTAGGSASSGTQALWMAAASAGVFAAAVVAQKVLSAQKEEQTTQIDLPIGRWVMRLSNNAAAQPAQQGQQSSAPAEEQAAAANE